MIAILKKSFYRKTLRIRKEAMSTQDRQLYFQSRDGQYVDQAGNVVNLAAFGIDVTKGG